MGRKGVSKRKPKKSVSNENNQVSSNTRARENTSSVQSLVNTKEATRNRGGSNPSAGSNKKNRKGK